MDAPLQSAAADPLVASAAVALSALSVALSIAVAAVLVRGYRRGPGRAGILYLAAGLLLLTTVPELLRIGLPTLTGVGTAKRSILVSGFELLGLGTVLWAVYGGGEP
ncbi:hypothetical protein [Candidatus Halobonum tyrrellensis]|uniref:Uncharacterized protein n=1 Tax=Candidatus Halobonum tyrrellensis G22 TaxID=1324957 RepID=V4HK01_9EURY|nr:hypothetical protein [Candidatus Halobonum tyrrellensis]ESP90108.1 hypothetical protein K933_01067 [Candidatus Halobonum tyrrellensis G22]